MDSALRPREASRREAGIQRRAASLVPYAAGPLFVLVLNFALALHGRPAAGQVYYGAQFWWDSQFYVAMSRLPVSIPMRCIGAPYCWRVLTPWLVHLMPGPPSVTFQVVTVASLMATSVAVAWILRTMGLRRSTAAWGGLAFATLGPATGPQLYEYALTDQLAMLLLALVVGLTLQRRHRAAAAALILLALAKEIVVIGIIFQVRRALSKRQDLGWALGSAVVALAVLFAVRLLIWLPPGQSAGIIEQLGKGAHHALVGPTAVPAWIGVTAGAWGLLLPLAVLQFVHPPRVWRHPEWLYIWLLATVQLFWNGEPRLVAYGFPAVILAAALEVEYLSRSLAIPAWRIWAPVLAFQVVWSVRYDLGTFASPDSLSSEPLTTGFGVFVLLVTVVAVVGLRRLRGVDLQVQPVHGPDPHA